MGIGLAPQAVISGTFVKSMDSMRLLIQLSVVHVPHLGYTQEGVDVTESYRTFHVKHSINYNNMIVGAFGDCYVAPRRGANRGCLLNMSKVVFIVNSWSSCTQGGGILKATDSIFILETYLVPVYASCW